MEYAYQDYWLHVLLLPSLSVLIPCCTLFTCIRAYQRHGRKTSVKPQSPLVREYVKREFMDSTGQLAGACVICALWFFASFYNILHGAGYLLVEKSEDALVQTITIEEVRTPSERYTIWDIEGKQSGDICAAGESYYILDIKGIAHGQVLEITYLPKSKVVLEVRIIHPL